MEIIADGGINAKVTQEVWENAVASLIEAIKDGPPADGVVAAIGGDPFPKCCEARRGSQLMKKQRSGRLRLRAEAHRATSTSWV